MKVNKLILSGIYSCIVFAALLPHANAQTDYLSVFGNNGCNQNHKLNCGVTPSSSSVTGINNLSDLYTGTMGGALAKDFLQNSMYDQAGNLLFSVNADGIYNPSGTQVYNFNAATSGSTANVPGTTCTVTYYPVKALSEICLITNPGDCDSYYAIFWCQLDGAYEADGSHAVLRAVKIYINPTTHAFTFTDNVLTADCSGLYYMVSYNQNFAYLAAANQNTDQSWDIYTVSRSNVAIGATIFPTAEFFSWHISTTGDLPNYTTAGFLNNYPPVASPVFCEVSAPALTKAKIFKVASSTHPGSTDLILAYIGVDPACGSALGVNRANVLQTINLNNNNDNHKYFAPYSGSIYAYQNIWGFEYLPPPLNVYCIAYSDDHLGTGSGGLAYAAPVSYTTEFTNFTPITGMSDYRCSDLELDKHGDMLMVYKDPTTGDGSLSYLPAAALTSTFTSTTPTRVTVPTCSLSTYGYVSVSNKLLQGPLVGNGFYLGMQNRNKPGYDLINYTAHMGEMWTPTSNPVTAITGIPTATISIRDWIDIPYYTNLYIQNMTVFMGPNSHINIYSAPSGSPLGVNGGILTLDASTVTAYPGCGGPHQLWGGVVINGDPAQAQLSLPLTKQGATVMQNNSVISFAQIGIEAGVPYGIAPPPAGGGIIQTSKSSFINNIIGVQFGTYRNFNPATPAIEINNISSFYRTNFINDTRLNAFPSGVYYGINGCKSKGINFIGCNFQNNTGSIANTYGIYAAIDFGFNVDEATSLFSTTPSQFSNYQNGIYTNYTSGSNTTNIKNSIFNNNLMGIVAYGGPAPTIMNNTFNIPRYTGPAPTLYPGTGVTVVNDQNLGVLLYGTYGYTLAANIFQTDALANPALAPYGYYPYTTGTLQYSTGSDPNMVTDNLFTGLGVAMLSNYINNDVSLGHGLEYTCNTDNHVNYDIAILGNNIANGGINPTQSTNPSTSLPAANKFAGSWNIYNQQLGLGYFYGSGPGEYPGTVYGPVSRYAASGSATCYSGVPGPTPGPHPIYPGTYVTASAAQQYAIAMSNINYYMTADSGIPHRDSLYYWASQVGTAYGDLLITNLLIEDSLIDSAKKVYGTIPSKYSLSAAESNDFAMGNAIIQILTDNRVTGNTLSASQASTLSYIAANTTMWAHLLAEGWLRAYNGNIPTDTLLYPYPDSNNNNNNNGGGNKPANTWVNNKVYPNPVQDILYVVYHATSNQPLQIQIRDIYGRIVITQSLTSGEPASIKTSTLVPGIYEYNILEGTTTKMTGKIAKQ